MCDQPRPVRAARAVSIREFVRSAASVVGEVELDGSIVVLSRRGTMVALLTPLPERTLVEFGGPRRLEESLEVDEEQPEIPKFEPLPRALLAAMLSAYPMPFGLGGFAHDQRCGASAASVAFGVLESSGLVEHDIRGRRLTREGVKVARWLDSRDDAPS